MIDGKSGQIGLFIELIIMLIISSITPIVVGHKTNSTNKKIKYKNLKLIDLRKIIEGLL